MNTAQVPGVSRAAGQIKVDLGVELKRSWLQWCVDRGLVSNKALRSLVRMALANGLDLAAVPSGAATRVGVVKQPDYGPKVSRELQFTPSENEAIEAVAKVQGFAFQEWVIAAARAALARSPAYGQAELEALTQSNAHMAQVVIELAALRRGEGDGLPADELAGLEGEIRRHVETVSATMAQGVQRWQLKV